MSDKYGYIGIETLLNFCSNQKDHCVTPNDFMRMNRVKIDERPHGEWIKKTEGLPHLVTIEWFVCSICGVQKSEATPFCPWCGASMRQQKGGEDGEQMLAPSEVDKLPEATFGASFHGELWLRCPHCNKGVEMYGLTGKHIASSGEYKAYICPHCNGLFKDA